MNNKRFSQSIIHKWTKTRMMKAKMWVCKNQTPKLFATAIRAGYPPQTVIDAFKKHQIAGRQKNFHIHDGAHGMEKIGAMEFVQSMMIRCGSCAVMRFRCHPRRFAGAKSRRAGCSPAGTRRQKPFRRKFTGSICLIATCAARSCLHLDCIRVFGARARTREETLKRVMAAATKAWAFAQ